MTGHPQREPSAGVPSLHLTGPGDRQKARMKFSGSSLIVVSAIQVAPLEGIRAPVSQAGYFCSSPALLSVRGLH
jgi:hypothetical protein